MTDTAKITINSQLNRLTTAARGASAQWSTTGLPDWIILPSFERVYIQRHQPEQARPTERDISVVVKQSSDTMLKIGCDRCGGPHSSQNQHCSANLKIVSPFLRKRPGLYDIRTGVLLTQNPNIIDKSFKPRSRLYQMVVRLPSKIGDRYLHGSTKSSSRRTHREMTFESDS